MKKTKHLKVLILFLSVCFIARAQTSTFFNNIKFQESITSVQKKVNVISNDISLININAPSFPLSNKKETHLVATMVKLENGMLDKVVFTFSDDKLCYIQARGNVMQVLTPNIKSEVSTYLKYIVYQSDFLFINESKDVAWQLTPESLHPNLFTWDNPYLNKANHHNEIKYNVSVKVPSFIKMGENIDDLLPLLKKHSDFIEVKKLERSTSTTKTQINCFGIEYAGFPRKFEARFENNKLNMVWILTGKGEENRLRKKLIEEYGKALFINNNWEVFNDWTVLLRKDKPEILLLTKEIGLMYKKQYSQ